MTSLVQSVDWLAIAPPAIAAAAALVVLVADLFLPERRKPLLGALALAGLVLAALALLPLLGGGRRTFCLTAAPDTCSYAADPFALSLQFLVLGGALLTALLSVHTVRDLGLPAGEYWFLLLASAAGAALLPASRDLATLVVALEVASLPAFALVGLRRGNRLSSEAALKFFLSSVVATAVMLLGVSFVYAATGSMHLSRVAEGLGTVPARLSTLATAGVALTLVGFAFKTAAAPFHFWVPDTYVGAPVPIAGYLSVVGKAAGFSGLILVTALAFPSYAEIWGPVVAVLAALTMTAGNAAALRQRPDRPHSAVRLLAWSSVGQAGYLLVPIAAAAYTDDPNGAIGTTVAYALMYAVVNLGAFGVTALVVRTRPEGRISDFRGLWSARPAAALALGFFLLALAGLPPGIIGLFAKVAVFATAVEAGLGWLAAVMAVNVVIALSYYLRWTAVLFRGPAREPAAAAPRTATAPAGAARAATAPPTAPPRPPGAPAPLTAAIGLAAVLGVALSGAPQLVLRFATAALL
ncbi:NADH-quinone oxidoreductase subunit N [Streptomyces sp. F63]|uniref:NADH-quinone oxidoreductase subunit N n=1 Tax=Streptomyces sp. F63 TaxID=2824887 RepID=UPI001B366DDE|nr:NADH-quinone oxidoreductase subunit N [Streptomyces sp. F63]MBQ0986192.1 NADH-quinone oxidoreductase subunit N [Streptomyces sp. F63]